MTEVVQAAPTAAVPSRTRFRIFWSGQTVSFVGSEVAAFTMPLVGVITLQASPAAMGLLVGVGLLPNLLAPFFAGPVADRVRKRPLMLSTDLARAVLLASVPALYLAGLLTVPLLVAIAFAIGMLSVLFDVGYFAFLPSLVSPTDLVRANGRLESSRSGATLVGPGLAGALVHSFAAPLALLVDAASFLVSAATLAALRGHEHTEPPKAAAESYLKSIGVGFSVIIRAPALRLLGLGSGAFNFFAAGSMAVTAIYVVRDLEVPAGAYGAAAALGGLGGALSGVLAGRVTDKLGLRMAFSGGLLVGALSEFVMVAAPHQQLIATACVALAGFIGASGVTVYIVANASLRQVLLPPEVRGRAYATMRMLNRSSMLPGAVLGGLLATATSPLITLLVVGVGQVGVALVFTYFRHLLPQRIEKPAAQAA